MANSDRAQEPGADAPLYLIADLTAVSAERQRRVQAFMTAEDMSLSSRAPELARMVGGLTLLTPDIRGPNILVTQGRFREVVVSRSEAVSNGRGTATSIWNELNRAAERATQTLAQAPSSPWDAIKWHATRLELLSSLHDLFVEIPGEVPLLHIAMLRRTLAARRALDPTAARKVMIRLGEERLELLDTLASPRFPWEKPSS